VLANGAGEVGHVDCKQSKDASMQTMQSSIISVTTVTRKLSVVLGYPAYISRWTRAEGPESRVLNDWLSVYLLIGCSWDPHLVDASG